MQIMIASVLDRQPGEDSVADWARATATTVVRLTGIQLRILDCIRSYQQQHSQTPTYIEIARQVGLARTSSVGYQIGRLIELGVLAKSARTARAIQITGLPVLIS